MEQATLSRIRYNRLVDTFVGLTAYQLQGHFRTTVQGMGQVEIDDLKLLRDATLLFVEFNDQTDFESVAARRYKRYELVREV